MTRIDDQEEEIFLTLMDFGENVTAKEAVTQNEDGSFTIFVNSRISANQQKKATKHALRHIRNHDFQKRDVQKIEAVAR